MLSSLQITFMFFTYTIVVVTSITLPISKNLLGF